MALAPGGAKQKGAAGELEAARLLQGWANEVYPGLLIERNLEQVRKGGADLNGVPGLEIEVKREEANNMKSWWRQVCKAADRTGGWPFLMHRKNRQPWRFRTCVYAALYNKDGKGVTVPLVVDMELDQAKKWFQEYLKQEKTNEPSG